MSIEKYSKIGELHKKAGAENQDVILIRKNSQFCFYALADGVSSRKFSREGAEIACNTAAEVFMRSDRLLLNYEKSKAIYVLLGEILYNIKKHNAVCGADIKEYASTLLFVLVDRKTKFVYVLNLGDGICLATLDKQIIEVACEEEKADGCCVTTTENVNDFVFFERYDAYKFDSFLMMSDGAWRMIYDEGHIKESYKDIIANRDMATLENALSQECTEDDCSFAFVDLSGLRVKG